MILKHDYKEVRYLDLDIQGDAILTILHSNYLKNNAGVEKVVLEQQNICMDLGMTFIAVFPMIDIKKIRGHHIYIKTGKYSLIVNGILKGIYELEELKRIIEKANFNTIIIHHLNCYKHNNNLIEYIKGFTCPVYYYIHDYATICYNHTLLKNNKTYCGYDGIKFSKCFNCRFFMLGHKANKFYKKLFNECQNIKLIFPSDFVQKIWLDIFGDNYKSRCRVISNQKFSDGVYQINKDVTFKKIKIAYIGYQNRVKGWEYFKKISEINKGQFELYVLGSCTEKLKDVKIIPVSFIDNGPNAMVEAIKANDIDIALLWSTRPETYGFTFYESYVAGTYILTNKDSGNISYMVKKLKCGNSFETAMELFEFLSDINSVKEVLREYYRENIVRPREVVANDEIFNLVKEQTGDYDE